jgi:hypothetical protein
MTQPHLPGREIFYLYHITLCEKFLWDLRVSRKIIGYPGICGILGSVLAVDYIALSEEIPEGTKLYLTDNDNRSIWLTIDASIKEFHCVQQRAASSLINWSDGIIGDYEKLLPSLRMLLEKLGEYEDSVHEHFNDMLYNNVHL